MGCGESEPSRGVFVGTLQGGEVVAASLWQADRVLIYACGRDASLDRSTAWLVSSPSDGTVEPAEGSFSAVATREEDQVLGTFESASGSEELMLREVVEPANAGLFARIDGPCRTALIAFSSGGGLRFQGAHFCDPEGPFFQVTPVRPPSSLGDRLEVMFDDGDGPQNVTLDRLEGI